MKKILSILLLTTAMLGFTVNSAQAGDAVGGFAVVNPETGVVHGVITGSIEYFGGNDKTMGSEYMGCPAGCLIVQQSTADQGGNVAGIAGTNVTYSQDRNTFQSVQPDTVQTQTIIESATNNSIIETEINVIHATNIFEFTILDYANQKFEFTEIALPQNTSAQVSATTKEFACEESATICSKRLSNSSNTLNEEVIVFDERKTSEQVLTQVISESKVKIREQVSLILSMLERWILN